MEPNININLIIIRHFKTFRDQKNNEKIKYNNAFEHSTSFIKFIKNTLDKSPEINNIKFITSPQERTIITGLIISNCIKNEIIEKKIKNNIKITEPVIDDILDRDPNKEKEKDMHDYFKNNSLNFNSNTLYIYITHSSVIYTFFKCLMDFLKVSTTFDLEKHISSYSLTYVGKKENTIKYKFNKNMK